MRIPRKQTFVMLNMVRAQAAMIQSQMVNPQIKALQLDTLGIDTIRGLQNIYKKPTLAV